MAYASAAPTPTMTIKINVVMDLFWFTSITSVVLLLHGAFFASHRRSFEPPRAKPLLRAKSFPLVSKDFSAQTLHKSPLVSASMRNQPTPSSELLLYPFRSVLIALWYADNQVDEHFFPILKGNGNASTTI